MLSNNKIIDQIEAHLGYEFDAHRIGEQLTAILFEDNPLRLKQQLSGKKAPLVSMTVHKTPDGPWLSASLSGKSEAIRLSVEEIPTGYRLTGIEWPKRTAPGRPVGSGDGRTVTFRVMLTPAERERVQRAAEENGETVSQFARRQLLG